MMSFFAMFSSAGNAFSVDAWLKGTSDFPTVDPWPLRLMQLQISIVYLRTVYWKLRGATWWNGTAVWYPIWVDTYLRYRPPRWMLSLPMIRLATWGTLIEELALGALIWVHEFHPYVMLSGIALHLVFECILNLRFFVYSNPLRERGIVFLSFSSDCKNPSLTLFEVALFWIGLGDWYCKKGGSHA